MTLVAVLATGVSERVTAAGVGWGYSGNIGPEHWGNDFAMYGMGMNQSPINITDDRTLDITPLVAEQQTVGSRPAGFLEIKFDYQYGFRQQSAGATGEYASSRCMVKGAEIWRCFSQRNSRLKRSIKPAVWSRGQIQCIFNFNVNVPVSELFAGSFSTFYGKPQSTMNFENNREQNLEKKV